MTNVPEVLATNEEEPQHRTGNGQPKAPGLKSTAHIRPKASSALQINGDFPLTDSGNAERFARDHGDVVHYCHPWDKWLTWNGRRWKNDDTDMVGALAKQTVRGIYKAAADQSDDDLRKSLAAWAHQSESAGRRAAMVKLARSEPGIPVLPADLDRDPWLLNLENGTLDLRTGQLRPHDKTDLITTSTAVVFDPQATCPTWQKFLADIFAGHQGMIGFMQRLLGYALTGVVKEHILSL